MNEQDQETELELELDNDNEDEKENNEYCENNCGQLLSDLREGEIIILRGKKVCEPCAIKTSCYTCKHCKEKFSFTSYGNPSFCEGREYRRTKTATWKAEQAHEKDCGKLEKCAKCGQGNIDHGEKLDVFIHGKAFHKSCYESLKAEPEKKNNKPKCSKCGVNDAKYNEVSITNKETKQNKVIYNQPVCEPCAEELLKCSECKNKPAECEFKKKNGLTIILCDECNQKWKDKYEKEAGEKKSSQEHDKAEKKEEMVQCEDCQDGVNYTRDDFANHEKNCRFRSRGGTHRGSLGTTTRTKPKQETEKEAEVKPTPPMIKEDLNVKKIKPLEDGEKEKLKKHPSLEQINQLEQIFKDYKIVKIELVNNQFTITYGGAVNHQLSHQQQQQIQSFFTDNSLSTLDRKQLDQFKPAHLRTQETQEETKKINPAWFIFGGVFILLIIGIAIKIFKTKKQN